MCMNGSTSDLQYEQTQNGPRADIPMSIGRKALHRERFDRVVFAYARACDDFSGLPDCIAWRAEISATQVALRAIPCRTRSAAWKQGTRQRLMWSAVEY